MIFFLRSELAPPPPEDLSAIEVILYYYYYISASFMFANAVVDSCSTCIRKSIFSLMSRLNTSTNIIVQSSLLQ